MKRIFSIAIFIGLLAYCFPLFAATIRVPADYLTIQAAIDAAVNGNIVTVADGKYSRHFLQLECIMQYLFAFTLIHSF